MEMINLFSLNRNNCYAYVVVTKVLCDLNAVKQTADFQEKKRNFEEQLPNNYNLTAWMHFMTIV